MESEYILSVKIRGDTFYVRLNRQKAKFDLSETEAKNAHRFTAAEAVASAEIIRARYSVQHIEMGGV